MSTATTTSRTAGLRAAGNAVPTWVWAILALAAAIAYPYFISQGLLDASISTLATSDATETA